MCAAAESGPLPAHVRVAHLALQRCAHFLLAPADSAHVALRALRAGLALLPAGALLPLAHALWAPLVALVRGAAPSLQRAALDVLLQLAARAKDFLRARAVR